MEDQSTVTPAEIYQAGDYELGIRWQDRHKSVYPCDFLRKSCRCAACIDEMTGKPILNPVEIPKDIHPLQIVGVGRYGIRIDWSDRHNTGIYSFKYLREICGCGECHPKQEG